jgi:hypothetical protein
VAGTRVAKCRPSGQSARSAYLQDALDAVDVAGTWEWDVPADRLVADALVALLFNVDPDRAERGVPFSAFRDGIHPDDRERTVRLIEEHARAGRSYLAEYRVCSADGVTRRVIARGAFLRDAAGRPSRGRGIIIDITRSRIGEDGADAEEPAPGTPLERAARGFLAGHKALQHVEDQPLLRQLTEMLLLETGRALAAQENRARRKRLS